MKKLFTVIILSIFCLPAYPLDLTVTIPDESVTRVETAFAESEGYQEMIGKEANPETKIEFVKRILIRFIKDKMKSYEINEYQAQLKETVIDGVDAITIIAK